MKEFKFAVAGAVTLLAGVASLSPALAETTLNALFMKQAAYSEDDVKAMTADFEKAHPDVKVNLEFVPYESLHDKIVTAQASGSGYDVVLFDVIWPAEFAKGNFLKDVTSKIPAADSSKVFDGAWSTVTYDGKRYGMPWILDTKYLYYNTEMLQKAGIDHPPKTWAELEADAKVIKDQKIVEYPIVWSWSQAEALICDYTTLVSAYGGSFFKDGKPSFNEDGALDALKFMKTSLDDKVTNPNSREYLEEDVRKTFSNGDAAFALNWTYMYNQANDPAQSKIAGKVGVAPAPGVEGKSEVSAMNGSMGLGVTSGSKHPDEAWSFISYLTSQDVQNKYAKLSLPIWKSSYDDPAVAKGQEQLVAAAKQSIAVMYPRPMIASYQRLSSVLQTQIQSALFGSSEPKAAMDEAAHQASRLR
ncbi:carbohydrate ABC transporter substrate-binding protein, CUT1 family [Faunimonas pinastri]|uniref:Carbohydrate ABC transporter substrate-binding protein, CUT1 family n=1 Tax=Faunimonas pinastri TaxID=1855383 RepID=A0A1H9PBS4_9HYPH|nr:extracellular solute-binding protein [Faunimonas pinastri]SER45592.1 carbohydrate ABC transporter substrate-binding protein, CUT1 family [Faunimonas pinastri]